MLNELREKVDKLINDTNDEKYILIRDILSNDKCFFNMDIDTAISILMDLNIEKEKAKKIYISMIDKENFE